MTAHKFKQVYRARDMDFAGVYAEDFDTMADYAAYSAIDDDDADYGLEMFVYMVYEEDPDYPLTFLVIEKRKVDGVLTVSINGFFNKLPEAIARIQGVIEDPY